MTNNMMRDNLIKRFGFDSGFAIGFMVMEMNPKTKPQDLITYYQTAMQYKN